MDEATRIKRLKEMERLNGSMPDPHELKSSSLMTGLATIFVIGLAVIIGMTLTAYWQPEAVEDFYPTPIVTSSLFATRELLPTPTLMPTWPPTPAPPRALATTVPTWTMAPSSTPVPTWTMAPTWTPQPTLTAAPTWTPQATHTAAPTYTPYPSPTAVPATETPTAIPSATATAVPTLLPPMLPPSGGPEIVMVEGGGRPWWFDALIVVEIALIVFIVYMEVSTWKYRRPPPLATPLPPPAPLPEPTKNTGAAPVSPVTPPISTSAAPVQNTPSPPGTISVSLQPTNQEEDEALLRELWELWKSLPTEGKRGETRSYNNVCTLKWGDKNSTRMALVARAVKWGREQEQQASQATPPTRPRRPFFVNTSRGREVL